MQNPCAPVYNISLVLNSALFVLEGGIGVSISLCDATKRILERYNEPSPPQLLISRLGTDAQLIGAIRLALTTAKQPSEFESDPVESFLP